MSMGITDIVFLAIILIAALRGAFRGMIQEIISLAALFISLLLATVFYSEGTDWIQSKSSLGDVATLIAFVAIFLSSYILFKILQKAIESIMNESPMEGLDKLLGFFFGILEGLLICFLIVYLLDFQTILDLGFISENSKIIPQLERFLPALDKPASHLMEKLSSGRA